MENPEATHTSHPGPYRALKCCKWWRWDQKLEARFERQFIIEACEGGGCENCIKCAGNTIKTRIEELQKSCMSLQWHERAYSLDHDGEDLNDVVMAL